MLAWFRSLSSWFTCRPLAWSSAGALYSALAHLARAPAFYQPPFNVPDTLEGRFDLLGLLVGTVCLRLSAWPGGAANAQPVFDLMFQHLELNLREAGTGDLSVPKQMRRFIQAFYGRNGAYAAVLEAGQGDLADVLARNIYNGVDDGTGASALAQWVAQSWWPVLLSFHDKNEINSLIDKIKLMHQELGHD